jgi:hypothetical protein
MAAIEFLPFKNLIEVDFSLKDLKIVINVGLRNELFIFLFLQIEND